MLLRKCRPSIALVPSRKTGFRRPLTSNATSQETALTSILIANRGEIALRVGRTALQHGFRTTVLYTDPDATSQHALSSSFALNLGDSGRYLDGAHIIELAKRHGCDAIHPGYGFLSENAQFAQACAAAGLNFIGPPASAIEAVGDKSRSKEIMTAAGVPCVPGYHGSGQDPQFLAEKADEIGYPVLLKAVKGGGGKGMRIVRSNTEFMTQLDSAKSEARSSFGDDIMLVEKYITTPRHIEVQIFADNHGNCVALGERDCSIQRRHQKIIEESPAPLLEESVRQQLWERARAAALAVNYTGAGTVEFIFDNDTGESFFMEMNTRLQVEHPVTEMVTGQDLVYWQLLVAQGKSLPMTQAEVEDVYHKRGHAIEARIYAENPAMNFVPDSGTLIHLRTPTPTDDVRIDAGFVQGDLVSSHYDPMIAKLIVRGADRHVALRKMRTALEEYKVVGLKTNIEFLKRLCVSTDFVDGHVETGYIGKHKDELFAMQSMSDELWMQAALGMHHMQIAAPSKHHGVVGFSSLQHERYYDLIEVLDRSEQNDARSKRVSIEQCDPATYKVTIDGGDAVSVRSTFDPQSKLLRSFFPHTRIDSKIVPEEELNHMTIFQQGKQYRIKLSSPKWAEKVLGTQNSLTNSVLAPMPCKVMRVDVKEGDEVKANQALVVIESMKMETVIRAPHDGVIAKVVHKAGDMCKAGTALVEFVKEQIQT